MIDLSIIKQFEGCRLKAYRCPANIWTIGYGSTLYPHGQPIKEGDTISQQEAENMLLLEAKKRLAKMNLPDTMSENRKAALLSFHYNVGHGNWLKSNLRRRVENDPNDEAIRGEFMKWNMAAGKVLAGLVNRRKAEAALYFSK
jgi:lysozyme